MDLTFQGFVSQTIQNPVVRTYANAPSSSTYNFSPDQEQIWNERCAIQREIEKDRIRNEIIAEENIKRKLLLEAEVRRELFMGREAPLMLRQQPLLSQSYPRRIESDMVHREMFIPENRRLAMAETYGVVGVGRGSDRGEIGKSEVVPFQRRPPSPSMSSHLNDLLIPEKRRLTMAETYGVVGVGRGGDRDQIAKSEVVPFQRRPPSPSPKIKEITADQPKDRIDITTLGKSNDLTVSGVKRKQPTPPLPAAASSSGVSLDSSKKRIEEWNCAICDVSATSVRGLSDHIAGKKHQAKVAAVKSGNSSGVNIGLVKNKNSVVEQQPLEIMNLSQHVSVNSSKNDKTAGKSLPKKFTRRCKLCKTGPLDDNGLKSHNKGKQHLKNLLKKERAKNRVNRKQKYANYVNGCVRK